MQSGNLYVYGVGNPIYYADKDGNISILAKVAIGAGINLVTTLVAAGVTGQKLSLLDVTAAILTGGLAAINDTAKIIAGVIGGAYTAIMTYRSGASLGGALVAGVVSGVVAAKSMSTIGGEIIGEEIDVLVAAAVDSVFSVAGNSISAATAKSAPVVSPRKSNSSNSAAVSKPQPKKPSTASASAPAAPSRAGGGGQKMLMVMY